MTPAVLRVETAVLRGELRVLHAAFRTRDMNGFVAQGQKGLSELGFWLRGVALLMYK